jgi:hypothetical protein
MVRKCLDCGMKFSKHKGFITHKCPNYNSNVVAGSK